MSGLGHLCPEVSTAWPDADKWGDLRLRGNQSVDPSPPMTESIPPLHDQARPEISSDKDGVCHKGSRRL